VWATGYKSISQGYNSTAAIKKNGQLWAWGYSGYGNLAQNDVVTRSSPIQIPGGGFSQVSLGANTIMALKTNGTLWSWAYNGWGQAGQNNRTTYSSPMQIPGTNWAYCIAASFTSAAIKTDGTLWTWGDNRYGQLGLNTGGSGSAYSSPTQVPGTTWSKIVPITNASVSVDDGFAAVKSDGTMWTWGANGMGQLGINNKTSYSSPVQVPGTNWVVDGFSGRKHGVTAFRSQS